MTSRLSTSVCVLALLLLGCGEEVPPGALELRATELLSVNGGPAEARLTTRLVRDGEAEEVDATFTVLEGRDVEIADGVVRAPGRAQTVRLRAAVEDGGETLEAELTLEARVRRDVLVNRLRFDALDRFRSDPEVDAAGSQLGHPLDGATVPANVAPLDFTFDGGEVGEHYRVTLESERVTVALFLQRNDPGVARRVRPDSESWARLLEDAAGASFTAQVDRLNDEGVVPGRPVTVFVAPEPLFADVVAWGVQDEPARSWLVRQAVDDREAQPLPDFGAAECTGCHASADGWLMVTRDLSDSLLVDLATGETREGFAPARPLDAASFAPGGGSMVVSTREWPGSLPPAPSELSWLDLEGAPLAATGLPEAPASSPALSEDALYYVEGGSDHPGGTDAATRLMRAPVTSFDPPALGAPTLVVDGADLADRPEGGETISRPAVTADGAVVVFAHGTRSRLLFGETSALYAARPGAAPVRLDAGVPPDAETTSAWPAVLRQGELVWVAYYGRGDGGWRDLWVTALDPARLDEGADPSSPPFRLPSSGDTPQRMAPSFVDLSCRAAEAACRSDAECCSGVCSGAISGATWSCAP